MNVAPNASDSDTVELGALDERRTGDRSSCEDIRPVRLLARPSFRALPGFIRDFSSRGIGLIMMRPFEANTMLAVQLQKRGAGVSGILTAHVRYSRQLGDHCWFIGCRLSRPSAMRSKTDYGTETWRRQSCGGTSTGKNSVRPPSSRAGARELGNGGGYYLPNTLSSSFSIRFMSRSSASTNGFPSRLITTFIGDLSPSTSL